MGSEPAQQRVMNHRRRVADTLQSATYSRAQDPLGREQRHLGVVCNSAVQTHVRWQLRNAIWETTADLRERQELDLGAQTVSDGTTQKTCMESDQRQPFMSGVIGHKAFLNPRLYCTGPCGADEGHGLARWTPALNQQKGGNRSRAPQPAPAMDQHPAAIFQDAMKVGRQLAPARHVLWRWHTQIGDRDVMPVHAACPYRIAKTRDGKQIELRILDQGQDCLRAPSLYHVQINIQIAVPSRAKDTVAFLAGAKGQTEMTVANLQAVDAKGVGCAGSKQVLFFLCRFEFRLRLGYVIFGRI